MIAVAERTGVGCAEWERERERERMPARGWRPPGIRESCNNEDGRGPPQTPDNLHRATTFAFPRACRSLSLSLSLSLVLLFAFPARRKTAEEASTIVSTCPLGRDLALLHDRDNVLRKLFMNTKGKAVGVVEVGKSYDTGWVYRKRELWSSSKPLALRNKCCTCGTCYDAETWNFWKFC